MDSRREFLKIKLDHQLDLKSLKSALSKTMSVVMANPSLKASPTRMESMLIENNKTTIVLSGNLDGLKAASLALRSSFPGIKISRPTTKRVVLQPPVPKATKG
jgi:hypothetical protein